MSNVKLGNQVKDKITGVEGIALGITDWLYGCRTVTVKPADLKDGAPRECLHIDEQQLEVTSKGLEGDNERRRASDVAHTKGSQAGTGGPERKVGAPNRSV